ncbi:MAG: dihydropteroate synthase [Deltaproteobacteria bacterium RBG_19FT_COMBO_52_11]|nr:MAG: dihydropteroate synthase [Deltaproteobacteria bacterium RBG_19FT_COMBO_52_11]
MEPVILRFRKKSYELSQRTLLMGVLNVTPDSFSDGGRFVEYEKAVKQGYRLAKGGADILDIGGESTRPGSKPLDEEEEIERIIPVIRELGPKIDIPISVDTRKARVAEKALRAGAEMINDTSALRFDERMAGVVREGGVPVVLMHMLGEPETMQAEPRYHDLLGEIIDFFRERVAWAESQGILPEGIILDPGIGFGKSLAEQHNLILLKHLQRFKILGKPLMIGTSRKAFIGRILGLPPQEREEGTMATVAVAILNGANIVRVHEVDRMRRVVQVVDAVVRCPTDGTRP